MSINIIKDNINELSKKFTELIISFLDIQSFSMKRNIGNSVYSTLVDYMELKSPFIINRETRKKLKKVYFSDDMTLPSCEIKSLIQEIKHKVNEDEYLEIIQYKNCYNNQDYLNALKRKKRRRKKEHEKRRLQLKIYTLNLQLENMIKNR